MTADQDSNAKPTERLSPAQIPREIYRALSEVEQTVNGFQLNKGMLGLLKLRASQINGCAYCLDMHHKEATRAGADIQRLYSLCVWREVPFFTAQERALLSWTEAVTLVSDGQIPDSAYAEMRAHFSEPEIARWTLAIIAINSWNRWMLAIRKVPGSYQPAPQP